MGRLALHLCEIDTEEGTVRRNGTLTERRLNEVLLRLLRVLVQHAGRDVSHDELRQQVWSDRLDMESEEDRKQKMRKVYIAVTRLRRAISDTERPYRHIVSRQPGFYRFSPLVLAHAEEEDECEDELGARQAPRSPRGQQAELGASFTP